MHDLLDRAIVANVPVLIKAQTPDSSGRRLVEVCASTEQVDMDGDVILQEALLGSANSFVAGGHLDLDHKSEIGHRMVPPIPDPSSYIVGRPLEVHGGPNKTTFVKGEIRRSLDGHNPERYRYDEFWDSLMSEPPVQWYASIYGFPGDDLMDCSGGTCPGSAATRYIVKSLDWRSLAFTKTPKNTGLTSPTKIVTAKSWLAGLVKGGDSSRTLIPRALEVLLPVDLTMVDVFHKASCESCGVGQLPSLLGYRQHFEKCLGYTPGLSDVFAHAMMHKHNMDRVFKRNADGVIR